MQRNRNPLFVLTGILLSFCIDMGGCGVPGTANTAAVNKERQNGTYTVLGGDDTDSDTSRAETYTRAMAKKSQVYDPQKSVLIPEAKRQKKAKKRDYTVMVYMIGSNLESLSGNATKDMEEMEGAGLDYDRTNLIVCTGGAQRWNSDIPCDQTSVVDLSLSAESRIVAHTDGNADMGAPDMLTAYVNFCTENYPADHYALIFWDHGGGPLLGYGDDELFDDDSLLLSEMKSAMAGTSFGKDKKLALVGFDACLMGCLESMAVWADYADYYVASSETEPGAGWDYAFLRTLNDTMAPEEIAASIITHYASYYENEKSAASNPDVTLSCIDLGKVSPLISSLGSLAKKLSASLNTGDYSSIQQTRAQVKSFGNLGGDSGKGGISYDLVDIMDFADKLEEKYPEESRAFRDAASAAVVNNYSNVEGASGLTMYFPYGNKDLYKSASTYLTNVIPSPEYRSFVNSLTETWLSGHTRDWKLAETAEDGDAYTLQLTDDQLNNMSLAYYTVFEKDKRDYYIPILEEIEISPDENGVLRVPTDPELICMNMGVKNDVDVWGFRQVSSDRKRNVYVSHTTGLSKKIDPLDFRVDSQSRFVNIYVAQDVRKGDTYILNVSSENTDGTVASKDSVDVTGYSSFYHNERSHYPQKNGVGATLPYSEWSGDSLWWMFYSEISGVPEFFTQKTSELEGEYALQIVICDTSGEEYGSEVIGLVSGDPAESFSYAAPSGTLTFDVYDDHAVATGYNGKDETLEIPAEIAGKPVTGVSSLDGENETVQKIIFPDSLKELGTQACHYMDALREVQLPEHLTKIGDSAFEGCDLLEDAALPDSVEFIGSGAFYDCDALCSVNVPKKCAYIGKGAFAFCRKLAEISVTYKNTTFKSRNGALLTADGKTLVAYPQGKAKEVIVPDGVEAIGYGAFSGAYGMENITFPDTLREIGYMAFHDCIGLKSIALPDSLVRIDEEAFGLSKGLYQKAFRVTPEERDPVTISIGRNVDEIGAGAFDAFLARTFSVDSDNPYYTENAGALMNKAGDRLVAPATDGTGVIVVPDGTVQLGWDMLGLCQCYTASDTDYEQINTEVYIPDSVTRFQSMDDFNNKDDLVFHCASGSAAWIFAEDNDITHDNVVSGDCETYAEKTEKGKLTYYVFADHVQLISYSGTDTSLAIPDKVKGVPVTVIGDGTDDGLVQEADDNSSGTSHGNDTVTEVLLPSDLTDIADYAFSHFRSLTKMNIPDSVRAIGSYALPRSCNLAFLPPDIESLGEGFAHSDAAGKYSLPASLVRIDAKAFVNMTDITGFSLDGNSENYSVKDGILCSADGTELVIYPPAGPTNAEIPDGVTRIGKNAFSSCSSLVSVVFGSTVTEIGESAFSGNTGRTEELTEVQLNDGLNRIGKSAFSGCSGLTSIAIPDTVTEIGNLAFSGCGLQSVSIPGSVVSIGDSAFYRNEDLVAVTFEEGLRTIGASAFSCCPSLTAFSLPDSLYSVDHDAFSMEFYSGDTEVSANPVTIHFGKSLTEIKPDIFAGRSIVAFTVDADNRSFKAVDGFLTDISGETIYMCPPGLSGEVTIPDGITTLANNSFYYCGKVTDVFIPDSVEIFASGVFPAADDPDAPEGTAVRTSTITIHCHAGSAAKAYAAENNIKCVTE